MIDLIGSNTMWLEGTTFTTEVKKEIEFSYNSGEKLKWIIKRMKKLSLLQHLKLMMSREVNEYDESDMKKYAK